MLNVRLLGGLSVFLDARRLALDLGMSGRLLAGYLFEFPARAHRREKLADHFWPDLPTNRARGALNTAVWRLRKTLALEPQSEGGRNLISTGNEVVLEPADWLLVDTHTFDESLGGRGPCAKLTVEQTEQIEGAVARYSGPFMDGDDDEWVVEERERLHSLYVRALGDLLRAYALSGQYEKAIHAARRILSVDKFRESVQRQFMLVLFLNDQRADAIRHFGRWRAALHEELNLDPMSRTCALAQAIASGELADVQEAWIGSEFRL